MLNQNIKNVDRLLVVDDQKGILQMLKRRFTKLDYEVFIAEDRSSALQILADEKIDLVLLDYMMPEISGFDFFLEFSKTYTLPVIMMTAHSSINLVTEFMRNGGADFIEKPMDIDALVVRIERAISQHRAIQREVWGRERAEMSLKLSNSELKEKTKKLEQKNKELSNFAASVCHDLKAPTRHINSFISLLKEKLEVEKLDKDTQELFQYVEESATKMNNMISEMLKFARMEETNKNIKLIDTHQLVGQIVDSMNVLKTDPPALFKIGLLPKIKGDAVLIEQVFFNLIHNAVKYSSKVHQPIIEVSANKEDDAMVFAVKDNGIGFNMEYAPRLFNLFARLHTEEEFEGTGLGLANVKRIVERHKGKVWAISAEGKGATFYFSIPDLVEQ